MKKNLALVDQADLDALIKKMDSVPFGNSAFQVEHFLAKEFTDSRKYRACLLQLSDRIKALKAAQFGRERTLIKIEEICEGLNALASSDRKARLLLIDLEEAEWALQCQEKLIRDALIEVKTYAQILDQIPEMTREQFESGEAEYWKRRLTNDATTQYLVTGGAIREDTAKDLAKIGIAITKDPIHGLQMLIPTDPTKLMELAHEKKKPAS